MDERTEEVNNISSHNFRNHKKVFSDSLSVGGDKLK